MGAAQSRKEKSGCFFAPFMLPIYELKKSCQKWKKQRKQKKLKKLNQRTMPRCSTFGSSLALLTPTKKPIIDSKYDNWKSTFEHITPEISPIHEKTKLIDTMLSGQLTPRGFPKHTDKIKAANTPTKSSEKKTSNYTFVCNKESKARRRLSMHLAELNKSPGVKRRRQLQRLQQQQRKVKRQQSEESTTHLLASPNETPKRHPTQTADATYQTRKLHKYITSDDNTTTFTSTIICTYTQPHAIIVSKAYPQTHNLADYDGTRFYGYYL